MKFSDDAILQAAAVLAAAQIQSNATLLAAKLAPAGQVSTPHAALVAAARAVMTALQTLEQQAREGHLDTWSRLGGG